MPASWVHRYLAVLGLMEQAPTREFLRMVVRRHFTRITYENFSRALTYRRDPAGSLCPSIAAWVEHIEAGNGGTCIAINYSLCQLLREIGFRCRLVDIARTHTSLIVADPETGRELFVDCGAMAPLFEPIDIRDQLGKVMEFGPFAACLWRDATTAGPIYLARYTGGFLVDDRWKFDPQGDLTTDDVNDIVRNLQLLARCGPSQGKLWFQTWKLDGPVQECITLANNLCIVTRPDGTYSRHTAADIDELRTIVSTVLNRPGYPVAEAVEFYSDLGGDIFRSSNPLDDFRISADPNAARLPRRLSELRLAFA